MSRIPSMSPLLALAAAASAASLAACDPGAPVPTTIRLATTTSTESSGLLAELLPPCEAATGVRVQVIAVGTGRALKLGEAGDVDVVLVHARAAEDAFVASGFGVDRRDVMWNDFVIAGPPEDPAGVRGLRDAVEAFRRIRAAGAPFASRGDRSGTHEKELELWAAAGVEPVGASYLSTGQGMGETLVLASEKRGYVLADRGTLIAFEGKVRLETLCAGDSRLRNPYGVIAVNEAKHPHVEADAVRRFVDWLVSPDGQARIAGFKKNGKQLFFPAAAGG